MVAGMSTMSATPAALAAASAATTPTANGASSVTSAGRDWANPATSRSPTATPPPAPNSNSSVRSPRKELHDENQEAQRQGPRSADRGHLPPALHRHADQRAPHRCA